MVIGMVIRSLMCVRSYSVGDEQMRGVSAVRRIRTRVMRATSGRRGLAIQGAVSAPIGTERCLEGRRDAPLLRSIGFQLVHRGRV